VESKRLIGERLRQSSRSELEGQIDKQWTEGQEDEGEADLSRTTGFVDLTFRFDRDEEESRLKLIFLSQPWNRSCELHAPPTATKGTAQPFAIFK
jgi:hypothetical protein